MYGSYIDEPIVRIATSNSETTWYHRNQQYSILACTDSSGAATERYAYTAYGLPTITDGSGTVRTSSAIGNRYTYTGREWDGVLGLYHYRARMYEATVGRFCSRDPIGYEDGPSQYEYSDFNPATYSDPLGLLATLQGTGPEITSIDNSPCATCCCCPVFIQVKLGDSGRKFNPEGIPEFHMGKPIYQANIHFTITMMYKPAPGTWFSRWFSRPDVHCKIAFAEFVEQLPVADNDRTPRGQWIDRVAEKPSRFKRFRDFPGPKKCEGFDFLRFTDQPEAPFQDNDVMLFWQYIAILGGRDCQCPIPKVERLIRFRWSPLEKRGINGGVGTGKPQILVGKPPIRAITVPTPAGLFPLPTAK